MKTITGFLAALAVLFAAGPVLAEDVPGLSDATRQKAERAIARGLKWLSEHQRDDGSWSSRSHPALTGLPLWAFGISRYDGKDTIMDKAGEYILSFKKEDGSIFKDPLIGSWIGGGLAGYNTAICMTALHQTGDAKYHQVILDARTFLAKCQIEGESENAGGFGYSPPKDPKKARVDLSNTLYALEAMEITKDLEDLRGVGEKKVTVNKTKMLEYLKRLQNQEAQDSTNYGGFAYSEDIAQAGRDLEKGKVQLRSYGSMTYAGLLSLIYSDVDRKDPRVVSALDWATKHWTLDENPGMGEEGLFYFFNVMAKALQAVGAEAIPREDGEHIKWREEFVNKLVALQEVDEKKGTGYWVNKNNRFWEKNSVLVTAYTIIALNYALAPSE